MTLSKRQKEIVRFARCGFENITGIDIEGIDLIPQNRKYNYDTDFGNHDIGVGRCYWAKFGYHEGLDRGRVNVSLSRYYANRSEATTDYADPTGRARAMNLKFRDVREAIEMPRIKIKFDLEHPGTSVESIVEDITRAEALLSGVNKIFGERESEAGYDFDVTCLFRRTFENSRFRYVTGLDITRVGPFKGIYSGLYLTLPYCIGPPTCGRTRDLTKIAKKTLTELRKAAN